MSVMKGRAIVLTVAMLLAFAGCASRPEVRANTDPTANLSSYKTFGFFDQVATDKSQYSTMLSSLLKDSTRRELEKRGYRYEASNPELLINFNVNLENRQDIQSTPSAGYYGYRGGMYGGWMGYPTDVQTVHYQVGTLSIDLVDAAKKQLVWEGIAQGRINKSALENPAPAVDRVVGEIFTKYPIPAPDAPAT